MKQFTVIAIVLIIIILWMLYKKFIAGKADYSDIEIILAEADVYISYGLYNEASKLIEKAIEANPVNLKLTEKLHEIESSRQEKGS